MKSRRFSRDARDLEIAKLGTFYSPVAGNPIVGYSTRPIFYAMMAVEQFAGSTLVETDFASSDVNENAYAARADRGWRSYHACDKEKQTEISHRDRY